MAGAVEVSLHQAAPADAELILSFMQQLRIEAHVEQHSCANDAAIRASLLSLIMHADLGRLWLIQSGERIVGYAAVTFVHSLEFAGRCGLIDEFFVHAEQRGKGVGKAALNWICQNAVALGIQALFLEVSPDNQVAQGLYRSVGFEQRPYHFMVRSAFERATT